MNITIHVDEITLDTLVAKTVAFDEDGDAYETGEKTVGHLVAEQLVERLVKDSSWPSLREQVMQIRAEVIRERVTPLVDAALTRPLRKTNSYGEPVGPETTLSELIVADAQKWLSAPADRHRSDAGTLLDKAIRTEVQRAVAETVTLVVRETAEQAVAEVVAAAKAQV
ncbi:hypothetical protein [Kitasatospora sp. McL0602]|uniref:hypothetical protein n=1 Tax=Kitasatospora sp. McL0602 TaxID=3439530 RepID=UPI003F89DC20